MIEAFNCFRRQSKRCQICFLHYTTQKLFVEKMYALIYNCFLSFAAYILSKKLINEFIPIFMKRNMCGVDLCKTSKEKMSVKYNKEIILQIFLYFLHRWLVFRPEPMGVIIATVYLMVLFLFIPAPFYGWMNYGEDPAFPYSKVRFLFCNKFNFF